MPRTPQQITTDIRDTIVQLEGHSKALAVINALNDRVKTLMLHYATICETNRQVQFHADQERAWREIFVVGVTGLGTLAIGGVIAALATEGQSLTMAGLTAMRVRNMEYAAQAALRLRVAGQEISFFARLGREWRLLGESAANLLPNAGRASSYFSSGLSGGGVGAFGDMAFRDMAILTGLTSGSGFVVNTVARLAICQALDEKNTQSWLIRGLPVAAGRSPADRAKAFVASMLTDAERIAALKLAQLSGLPAQLIRVPGREFYNFAAGVEARLRAAVLAQMLQPPGHSGNHASRGVAAVHGGSYATARAPALSATQQQALDAAVAHGLTVIWTRLFGEIQPAFDDARIAAGMAQNRLDLLAREMEAAQRR